MAGGSTIAVLAGGVDVPYPRAHTTLLARIVEEGAVVSESPLGESVRRQRFLSRNRVIAALGRATLVVEAADRSGTTATARAASAMNRPVLAVPGPIFSASSAGCHRMIREGLAILVSDVPDLLDMLDLSHGGRAAPPGSRSREAATRSRDSLGARERTVLDALPARGVIGLDALVRAAGLSHTDVLAGIGILTADGWAVESGGGWRLVRAGRPGDGGPRA
jgi:DNA processing protein